MHALVPYIFFFLLKKNEKGHNLHGNFKCSDRWQDGRLILSKVSIDYSAKYHMHTQRESWDSGFTTLHSVAPPCLWSYGILTFGRPGAPNVSSKCAPVCVAKLQYQKGEATALPMYTQKKDIRKKIFSRKALSSTERKDLFI